MSTKDIRHLFEKYYGQTPNSKNILQEYIKQSNANVSPMLCPQLRCRYKFVPGQIMPILVFENSSENGQLIPIIDPKLCLWDFEIEIAASNENVPNIQDKLQVDLSKIRNSFQKSLFITRYKFYDGHVQSVEKDRNEANEWQEDRTEAIAENLIEINNRPEAPAENLIEITDRPEDNAENLIDINDRPDSSQKEA